MVLSNMHGDFIKVTIGEISQKEDLSMGRKTKKLVAVLFSLALVFGLTLTAYAGEDRQTDPNDFAVTDIADRNLSSSATIQASTVQSPSSIIVGVGCGMPECYEGSTGCYDGCFDQWGYCTCVGTQALDASKIIYTVSSSDESVVTVDYETTNGEFTINKTPGATTGQTAVITVKASFHGFIGGETYEYAGTVLHSNYDTEDFTVTIQ